MIKTAKNKKAAIGLVLLRCDLRIHLRRYRAV